MAEIIIGSKDLLNGVVPINELIRLGLTFELQNVHLNVIVSLEPMVPSSIMMGKILFSRRLSTSAMKVLAKGHGGRIN